MLASNAPKHRFIVSTHVHLQDRQQRDLQLSDIRSHARHISYLRWRNAAAAEKNKSLQQQKSSVASPGARELQSASPPNLERRDSPPGGSPESWVHVDTEDIMTEAQAEMFLKDVWMPTPTPTWSKGDPFDCIPGSNEYSARVGLDFRKLIISTGSAPC
jgi:hypothetical protein